MKKQINDVPINKIDTSVKIINLSQKPTLKIIK